MRISLSTAKRVIVVDVQPTYDSYSRKHFDTEELCQYLNRFPDILFLYNGRDTGMTGDTEWDLRAYYEENGLDLDGKTIKFVDKGYGYLRDLMDAGVEERDLIKLIRYMLAHRINDSREIDSEVYVEIIPDHDQEDYMASIPDVSLKLLKEWSNSYIVGGGRTECLKEVQILMNALNIRYKVVAKFVY